MTTENIFTIGKLYLTHYHLQDYSRDYSPRIFIPTKSYVLILNTRELIDRGNYFHPEPKLIITLLYKSNVLDIELFKRNADTILTEVTS